MLVANEINTLSNVAGNSSPMRKFFGMSGDGAFPSTWNWYTLTPDDIPDNIPASKIIGLGEVGVPTFTGDASNAANASVMSVTGLRGRPLSSTAPGQGQVLTFNTTSGEWEPKSPAPGGVTGFNGRTGAVTPQSGDYSFSMLSGQLDASKVGNGTVSNSAFNFLANVTSDVQAQMNSKVAAGADVTAAGKVTQLQGYSVSATAPTTGYVMGWTGSQWAPQAVNTNTITVGAT
jgi:hypothetical protein